MQFVAINWHVYLLTKSAFALGLVGLFRGLPIIFCSLAGGVIADAFDRRRLMVVTQTVMLLTAALLTTVTLAGLESVWPIYVLSGIASAAQAFYRSPKHRWPVLTLSFEFYVTAGVAAQFPDSWDGA